MSLLLNMLSRRQWHPTPVLLPGRSHERRSLVGCSPWGSEESDMTEWLHFHFSLLCIREGNGNPLQCSCLKNPEDGVTQSWTWLKWLSSSSSGSSQASLEKEVATHTSILAWRIPWTEKPGGLQSTGSQRVGHDWATNTHRNLLKYCYAVFCIIINDRAYQLISLHLRTLWYMFQLCNTSLPTLRSLTLILDDWGGWGGL